MITLSSDFGSPYPAAMKGVICQRTDARLVDVTHDFPRQDVRSAAFWLREVLPYFPPAVHLVVVDPGVGTERDALVVRAGDHTLVGPDNGVLVPAARRLAGKTGSESVDPTPFDVFRVRSQDPSSADDVAEAWPPVPESSTFHGRDVFAPTAAHVHEIGIETLDADEGLEPLEEFVDMRFPTPELQDERAIGEILVVDEFGNAITNVPGTYLDGRFGGHLLVDDEVAPVCRTYADVAPGERLVTVGSHENVELAVNQGRGDDAFDLAVGETVQLDRDVE